jgi:hypothetical protein
MMKLSANSPKSGHVPMYFERDPAIPPTATRAVSARPGTPPAASPSGPAAAPEQPRCVVQLLVSAAPFEPGRIPRLDIFDLYRLYTDVTAIRGRVWHVLRLGFFKQARTARPIARYLASYFEAPTIVQVDEAEVVRSLQHGIKPHKDVGASGLHAAIELTAPAEPQGARPPALVHSSQDGKPAPDSLWSRLFGHR